MERSSSIHSHTHGRQGEIQTHKKKAFQRRKERKSAREREKPRGGEGEPSKQVGFRHMGTQGRGAEKKVGVASGDLPASRPLPRPQF